MFVLFPGANGSSAPQRGRVAERGAEDGLGVEAEGAGARPQEQPQL